VVLLMLWLPDGLLSIPDRMRARKRLRQESAARMAAGTAAAATPAAGITGMNGTPSGTQEARS
jgi:branched-chain amino acid transport system permease protein